MAELNEVLAGLRPDDVRVDPFGRVVIVSPSIVDKIKASGAIGADELARSDTNIICCGNSKCGGALDLGSIMERVTNPAFRQN